MTPAPKNRDGYFYYDEGPESDRPPVVCLHGMLGEPENWFGTLAKLTRHGFRVLIPELPVYDLPIEKSDVRGLAQYVQDFLETLAVGPIVLAGNSLGGHVAILRALEFPAYTSALVLAGSSGIYEVEIGTSMMRRQDRAFIRDRAARTFFSPDHVSDHLVDRVFDIVNDRNRALRLIRMARSALRENLSGRLHRISAPTLLMWGRDDQITPPSVAEIFHRRIPRARLCYMDRCGHAPMIEKPAAFNRRLLSFLNHLPPRSAEPEFENSTRGTSF